VVKHALITLAAVVLMVAASVAAQQKPATSAEKEAAEQKAATDAMAKMAAQQAEAVARAQMKVAEEARRAEEERVRQLERKRFELIPVDVEVVISRYQNDKRVSSLPYALAVNAGEETAPTKLRMGANVPVPSSTFTPVGADGKAAVNPLVSYNYQNVGTNIDCVAKPLGDGRFSVYVSVGERSVVQPPATCNSVTSCAPVIRNFEAENTLVLRDGQTRQFTAAADRVTGEVVKVDVTLKVAK
jgi:hypothetical protein